MWDASEREVVQMFLLGMCSHGAGMLQTQCAQCSVLVHRGNLLRRAVVSCCCRVSVAFLWDPQAVIQVVLYDVCLCPGIEVLAHSWMGEGSGSFEELSSGFVVLKGRMSWNVSVKWCYLPRKRQWWIIYSPAFVFGRYINKGKKIKTLAFFLIWKVTIETVKCIFQLVPGSQIYKAQNSGFLSVNKNYSIYDKNISFRIWNSWYQHSNMSS